MPPTNRKLHTLDRLTPEHVSGAGAGAENGAEQARKCDERERSGSGT